MFVLTSDGPKSHQCLWSDTKLQLAYIYTVLKYWLKHTFIDFGQLWEQTWHSSSTQIVMPKRLCKWLRIHSVDMPIISVISLTFTILSFTTTCFGHKSFFLGIYMVYHYVLHYMVYQLCSSYPCYIQQSSVQPLNSIEKSTDIESSSFFYIGCS